MNHSQQFGRMSHEAGLQHLPVRTRPDVQRKDSAERILTHKAPVAVKTNTKRREPPENLNLVPITCRLRSPTESSISSILSANIPDSATTHSLSTLASPISTSYGDLHDGASCRSLDLTKIAFDQSRPSSRVFHRHQRSTGSCSTFVNDEDDGAIITGYPDFSSKLVDPFHRYRPATDTVEESSTESQFSEVHIKHEPVDELDIVDSREGPTPVTSPKLQPETWDTTSTASDDFSTDDANTIMNHTLQLVYGVDLEEMTIPSAVSSQIVGKFVREVSQHIWRCPTAESGINNGISTMSTPSQGGSSGESQRGGKRKKQGKNEEDGDEFSDGEGVGSLPKRPRPNPKDEENLRLSCPFRKRNPHRFNVRDHHSCAMTYFPKFAELRQHIVKQHKRDDPSAFVCDRCNRDFPIRKELRDHQRLPKELMCDISDHDPESGIDGPTANKLLSRKRASGASAAIQWREIWNVIFPDDDDRMIRDFHYTPVIEHFELSTNYMSAFQSLHNSLRDLMSNPNTLETLATKFEQCFIETVESCIADAQSRPYTNRSNKRNEPQNTLRKGREVLPRPDSGVVIDDASEESGSIIGPNLEHRESVRTIRSGSARNSKLGSIREVRPAPQPQPQSGVYEQNLLQQLSTQATFDLSTVTGPMDPAAAAVEAWDNGVMPPFTGDQLGLPDYLMMSQSQTMSPYPGAVAAHDWQQQVFPNQYGAMGNDFTGFDGRQH